MNVVIDVKIMLCMLCYEVNEKKNKNKTKTNKHQNTNDMPFNERLISPTEESVRAYEFEFLKSAI